MPSEYFLLFFTLTHPYMSRAKEAQKCRKNTFSHFSRHKGCFFLLYQSKNGKNCQKTGSDTNPPVYEFPGGKYFAHCVIVHHCVKWPFAKMCIILHNCAKLCTHYYTLPLSKIVEINIFSPSPYNQYSLQCVFFWRHRTKIFPHTEPRQIQPACS